MQCSTRIHFGNTHKFVSNCCGINKNCLLYQILNYFSAHLQIFTEHLSIFISITRNYKSNLILLQTVFSYILIKFYIFSSLQSYMDIYYRNIWTGKEKLLLPKRRIYCSFNTTCEDKIVDKYVNYTGRNRFDLHLYVLRK